MLYNSISQSDQITALPDWRRYTFHEALTPHLTAGAVGRYAFGKYGKRVVFLSADYAYGHEMVARLQGRRRGRRDRDARRAKHPLGATDFSTLLPRIQALKPDILCLTNFGRDQQIAIKQATDFGLKRTTQHRGPRAALHRPRRGRRRRRSRAWSAAPPTTGAWRAACPRQGVQRPLPQGQRQQGAVRLRRAGLCRGPLHADGREAPPGRTDTEKVVDALSALKYDIYKGPEHIRACDHQSVQPVFIMESKSKGMPAPYDVFNIVAHRPAERGGLRSPAPKKGHT